MNATAKRIIALICVLLLPGALGSGCIVHGSAAPVPDLPSPIERICKSLSEYTRRLSERRVVGDHVVTGDPGGLRGKLPPAQPVELVTRGNPNLKRVAITIDDGWNADMRILDLLKKWKIRFTAFLIGDRGIADAHPEFVRRIQDSGGEVCSHTYTHYIMRGKDEATVVSELWRSQDIITHVTHEIYPYVRFSGGAYDAANLTWSAREGFWVVNWTVSSGDTSKGVSADFQVNNILANVGPGAILLFHFGGYNTYEVLARTIPEMQRRGFEVTSLSRVLEGTPFVLKKPGV